MRSWHANRTEKLECQKPSPMIILGLYRVNMFTCSSKHEPVEILVGFRSCKAFSTRRTERLTFAIVHVRMGFAMISPPQMLTCINNCIDTDACWFFAFALSSEASPQTEICSGTCRVRMYPGIVAEHNNLVCILVPCGILQELFNKWHWSHSAIQLLWRLKNLNWLGMLDA